MKTIQEVADISGVTYRNVQRRAKLLGIQGHYKGHPGRPRRLFTDEEAERIRDYQAKKRKKKIHRMEYRVDVNGAFLVPCDIYPLVFVGTPKCHTCGYFKGYRKDKQYVLCDAERAESE
jgi:hypothetical protein